MKSNSYTVLYAGGLAVVCALALTAVGRFTEPYRKANEKAEEVRNILAVLGVPFEERASAAQLVELYHANVRETARGGAKVYEYVPAGGGAVERVAVELAGPGLWGPIHGFLALSPDYQTLRGLALQKQEETPGLGGEIVKEKFRGQFDRKSVHGPDGAVGIRIRKPGGALGPNEVDGISGATLTSTKVEALINDALRRVVQ